MIGAHTKNECPFDKTLTLPSPGVPGEGEEAPLRFSKHERGTSATRILRYLSILKPDLTARSGAVKS